MKKLAVLFAFLCSCSAKTYQVHGLVGPNNHLKQPCKMRTEGEQFAQLALDTLATIIAPGKKLTEQVKSCIVYEPEPWGKCLANGGVTTPGGLLGLGKFMWAAQMKKNPIDPSKGPYCNGVGPRMAWVKGDWKRTLTHETVHVGMKMWLGRYGYIPETFGHTEEFKGIQKALFKRLEEIGVLKD